MMKLFLSLISAVLAFSAMAATLPEGTRIIAQGGSYDVFVTEPAASTSDADLQPVSLWTCMRHNGESRCILTTHPEGELDMDNYSFFTPEQGKVVTEQAVKCVDHVWVHPYNESILVLSGIPDSRNVYTFILNVENGTLIHLPSNAAFKGFTDEDGDILVESYSYYPEGGRYSVVAAYDLQGRRVGFMELKHNQ
jgi:hypothetical protein